MLKNSTRFYYGWIIVIVSFVTVSISGGIRFSFGLFYLAILNEYSWNRAETALTFSLSLLTYAFFSTVSGYLLDRFGPRKLFCFGGIFLSLSLAATSLVNAMWQLYLSLGIVMAIGINMLSFVPHMALVSKWFYKKRGLANGVVGSGNGVGTLLFAPVIQFLIDAIGWRNALLVLSGMILAIIVPLNAFLQKGTPEELSNYNREPELSRGTSNLQHTGTHEERDSQAWTIWAALRTSNFWFLFVLVCSIGFHINTLVVHQAAHVTDAGYSPIMAASVIGLYGMIRSLGGISGGFLSDNTGREAAFTIGSCFAFAGLLVFSLIGNGGGIWLLYAFVLLYGLGHGSMGPIYASAVADVFPGGHGGRILGALEIGYGVAGALGVFLGGYLRDMTGSYSVSFLLMQLSILLGIACIWLSGPRRKAIN